MYNKNNLINKALLAKELGRPHDMVLAMKLFATTEGKLNTFETELLSDAYKGVCEPLRAAFDKLNAFGFDYYETLTEQKRNILISYMENIKEEIQRYCGEIQRIMHTLVCGATDNESKVVYTTLKGNYVQYLSEITVDADDKIVLESIAYVYYRSAYKISQATRTDLDLARLGVALEETLFDDKEDSREFTFFRFKRNENERLRRYYYK